MTHSCVPALPAVFTCQSVEYRERTKHTVELSSCQRVETTDRFYGGSAGMAILSQNMYTVKFSLLISFIFA